MPSAATTRSASRSPSLVATRAGAAWLPGPARFPGFTSVTVTPVRSVPAGSRLASSPTRSARSTISWGSPKRSAITPSSVRTSQRPSGRRIPPSPWIAEKRRTSSPRPIASRACSAFGARPRPAPTGSRAGARSRTVTSQPWCRSATAAVSPPIPAPATTARPPPAVISASRYYYTCSGCYYRCSNAARLSRMAITPSARTRQVGDAAIAVLAEHGARGLTHRAVDQAAGLPPGTTSNYARTRAALLTLVLTRIDELDTAEATGGVDVVDVPDALADVLAALLDRWITDPGARRRVLAR